MRGSCEQELHFAADQIQTRKKGTKKPLTPGGGGSGWPRLSSEGLRPLLLTRVISALMACDPPMLATFGSRRRTRRERVGAWHARHAQALAAPGLQLVPSRAREIRD